MAKKSFLLATAPLKVILFGEHAVMAGYGCISLAVNPISSVTVCSPGNGAINVTDSSSNFFRLDLKTGMSMTNNVVNINVAAPFGCGLGTSASFSVLAAAAIVADSVGFDDNLRDYATDAQKKLIKSIANAIENKFHGKTSGVDVETIFHGGLIYYRCFFAEQITMEHLKNFKIMIYHSGIKKNTGKVLQRKFTEKKESILQRIKNIVERVRVVMSNKFSLNEIYPFIRENQDCLVELGLVPDEMKAVVKQLRETGIESKITGAGDGGCLVTIVEKNCFLNGWKEAEIDENGLRFWNFV